MSMLERWFGHPSKKPAPPAKAAAAPPPPAAPAAAAPKAPEAKPAERGTSTRKKPKETARRTKARPRDEQAFLVRGKARLGAGDHDGAIEDFTKAIEMNAECFAAYEGRGVARERKGDTDGAKADYMKSISIQVSAELNRQMRENPDVEV